jgi:Ca-activated chloride channel family protein
MRLAAFLRTSFANWSWPSWDQLVFDHRDAAILAALAGITFTLIALLIRVLRQGGRADGVALPAFLAAFHRSPRLQAIRYLPAACFVAGIPFFLVALADPVTRLTREQVTYPGRRIALFVDASASMTEPFKTTKFKQVGAPSFFTSIAVAEYFIRLRMEGQYRDLIALLEFGDEAYVLTPFTTDYENLLLTLSLINTYEEWVRFDAPGTVIINALDVAIGLFRAFDFLEASGNAMILISDGDDSQVRTEGRPLDEILSQAVRYKIPVYMLRVAADKKLGDILPDTIWKAAVEKTGGRFYPVANEAAILPAVHDIDQRVVGEIDVTRYAVNTPRFAPFAVVALVLWGLGLALRVAVPHFGTFP